MEIWNQVAWYVELLFNVMLFVLPTLAAVAATTATGALVIRTSKQIYREWIRPAVDQPTDALVLLIAKQTGRDASVVSSFLVENLDAVIALLPDDQQILADKLVKSIQKDR